MSNDKALAIQKEATLFAYCPNEMLTVPEVAKRLRVAPSWVYGHAALLGAYRLGKYLRFDWERVLERLVPGDEIETSDVGVAAQRPLPKPIDQRG